MRKVELGAALCLEEASIQQWMVVRWFDWSIYHVFVLVKHSLHHLAPYNIVDPGLCTENSFQQLNRHRVWRFIRLGSRVGPAGACGSADRFAYFPPRCEQPVSQRPGVRCPEVARSSKNVANHHFLSSTILSFPISDSHQMRMCHSKSK